MKFTRLNFSTLQPKKNGKDEYHYRTVIHGDGKRYMDVFGSSEEESQARADEIVDTLNALPDIISLVKGGLTTDGDHHKQFYLHEIANLLNLDIDWDSVDRGIPG